jgi:hypothetical protein
MKEIFRGLEANIRLLSFSRMILSRNVDVAHYQV